MAGASHRHVSDHLSELVEGVVADLEASKVIAVVDGMDLEPLNLGMVAAYYYVAYTTIELFAASAAPKTRLRGLVEILAAASEYDALPVRPGEERAVERLLRHAPLALDAPRYTDPHTKVNALLQAHISRSSLSADLARDRDEAVAKAPRLLQALVDVVATSGWLAPALAAMELSQMLAQARWAKDPPLLQVPGLDAAAAARCAAAGVETVFDLAEADAPARRELLQLPDEGLAAAAAWLARYPDVGVTHELPGGARVAAGEPVTLAVALEREGEGAVGPAAAPRFPGRKDENWWLVVGDPATNALLAIKRVALGRRAKAKLEFVPPPGAAGRLELTLFLMCDAYLGADQEFPFELEIEAADMDGAGGEAADGGAGADAGDAAPMEAE
jgi:pre-mRNA-splicing helicase BRR2